MFLLFVRVVPSRLRPSVMLALEKLVLFAAEY